MNPMRRPSLILGALLGAASSVAVIAVLFLGNRVAGLPFVPFDFFDWLARVLPGNVITLGIDAIVRLIQGLNLSDTSRAAKMIEQGMALLMMVGAGALLGLGIAWALRRSQRPAWQVGLVGGALLALLLALVEGNLGLVQELALGVLWIVALVAGWGTLLGSWLGTAALAASAPPADPAARRAAVAQIVGGSAAMALGAWGVGRVLGPPARSAATGAGQSLAGLVPTAEPSTATVAASPTLRPSATLPPSASATLPPSPTASPTVRPSATRAATATDVPTATATAQATTEATATAAPPTADR